MSAVATTLAIQAAKKLGEFLIEKYGDDAARALLSWIEKKRAAQGDDADVPELLLYEDAMALDSMERGMKEALIELGRPYDDFFGPRVGAEKPTKEPPQPPAPVPGPTKFPYHTLLHFHPLQVNEAYLLDPRDTIWVDGDRSLWFVASWSDPTAMVPVIGVTWQRDPIQVPQKG